MGRKRRKPDQPPDLLHQMEVKVTKNRLHTDIYTKTNTRATQTQSGERLMYQNVKTLGRVQCHEGMLALLLLRNVPLLELTTGQ